MIAADFQFRQAASKVQYGQVAPHATSSSTGKRFCKAEDTKIMFEIFLAGKFAASNGGRTACQS
jgi:hypothetical protein